MEKEGSYSKNYPQSTLLLYTFLHLVLSYKIVLNDKVTSPEGL